jgi:hypothetical protein
MVRESHRSGTKKNIFIKKKLELERWLMAEGGTGEENH